MRFSLTVPNGPFVALTSSWFPAVGLLSLYAAACTLSDVVAPSGEQYNDDTVQYPRQQSAAAEMTIEHWLKSIGSRAGIVDGVAGVPTLPQELENLARRSAKGEIFITGAGTIPLVSTEGVP